MNAFFTSVLLLVYHLYAWNNAIDFVPVFTPGEGGYPCIRVPAIASTASGTLVAFAECRNYTGDGCDPINFKTVNDDSSQRWVCQKFSTDDGRTWSKELTFPFGLSHTSYNPTIVYDRINQKLVLQANVYNLLPNQTIYQIESANDGKTWSNIIDVGAQLFPYNKTNNAGLWPGPSTGLQLSNKSRILWSGHTSEGSYVWYSDDGKNYQFSKTPFDGNNLPHMEEGEVVELSNGSLIDNMRNSHYWSCDCRGFAMSNDDGLSFSAAYPSPQLISPECEGSTISVNMNGKFMILFSNPDSTTQRMNMTVKKSVDDAETWSIVAEQRNWGGGYSCLTTLAQPNNTHIGLLWETNNSQACSGGVNDWACMTVFSAVAVGN